MPIFVLMSDTFKTIGRYQYTSEAQIIKGRLESEGIKVFLSDNLTIDTDPLVSNAIGGVKLKVLSRDESVAREIIESIHKYSTDDIGKAIDCPNCNGQKVQLYSTVNSFKSLVSFLVGFIFGALPFHMRYKYKCEDCNAEFNIKKTPLRVVKRHE